MDKRYVFIKFIVVAIGFCLDIVPNHLHGMLVKPMPHGFHFDATSLEGNMDSFHIINSTHRKMLHQQFETIPPLPDDDPDKKEELKRRLTLGSTIKNMADVNKATQHCIAVTQKTLESLKNNFDTTALEIDLFGLDNLRIALLNVLSMALDPKAGAEFPQDIRSTEDIRKSLDTLKTNLLTHWETQLAQEEVEVAEQDIEQKKLEYTYRALDEVYKIISVRETVSTTLFAKFIYGMVTAYKVAYLRLVTDKILNTSKTEMENATQKTTKNAYGSLGATASYGIAKAGITISAHRSEEMKDTSFYQIEVGGGVKLNVEVGVGKFLAKMGGSVAVARAAIFYSLEQLVDSGKFTGGHLKLKALTKFIDSRKAMQEHERKLLAIFSGYIESFLKIVGIIPSSAAVLVTVTRVSENETANSIELAVEGEVSFSSIGLVLRKNVIKKVHTKRFGILSLIQDDCSPVSGGASNLSRILGSAYDLSLLYLDQIEDYKDSSGNFNEHALVIILSNILDDIRRYTSVLSKLAESSSDRRSKRQLENEKHLIESRWLVSQSRFNSEGREGVLRALTVTTAKIRELCNTPYEIVVFNQIYNELCKLAALCEFSKDKKKRNAEFSLQAEAYDSIWSGTLKIPGGITIIFSRTHAENHPFMEDNGEFIDVEITLPMTLLGLVGMKVVQSKLVSMFLALSKRNGEISEGLGNAGSVIQDVLLLLLRNSAIPFISNVISIVPIGTSRMSIRLRRLDVFSCSYPLPGTSTIIDRDKNRWEILYIQTMALSNLGLEIDSANIPGMLNSLSNAVTTAQGKIGNLPDIVGQIQNAAAVLGNISNAPASFQVSFGRTLGKRERIIGSNALFYIIARYNVMMLGNSTTMWDSFTSEQAQQFWLLFANICNLDSDARYELQVIYNKILNNTPDSKKEACTQKFSNFLQICDTFSDLPAASKAFVDFLPLYNKFSKNLIKCQETAQRASSVRFDSDALLSTNIGESLSQFIGDLHGCRTSSNFRRLYEQYHDLLLQCSQNTQGQDHRLFKKLRRQMHHCDQYAEKILQRKYFAICESAAEKARNCHSSAQYKKLLEEFRNDIRMCPESPLTLATDSAAVGDQRDPESTVIELDEVDDTEQNDEVQENEGDIDTQVASSDEAEQNDGEGLPSNYEKVIVELEPELLAALDPTNPSQNQSVLNLMLAISKSKKGLPVDYEAHTDKIENKVKRAMFSVAPQLLAIIASLNLKIQKLLADTVVFNVGVLTLFTLLRSQINAEYPRALEAFNKVLLLNHRSNFLLERDTRYATP